MTTRSQQNRFAPRSTTLPADGPLHHEAEEVTLSKAAESAAACQPSLSGVDAIALGLVTLKPMAFPATQEELEASWLKPEGARRKPADEEEDEDGDEEDEDDDDEDEEEDEEEDDEDLDDLDDEDEDDDDDEDEDDDYLDEEEEEEEDDDDDDDYEDEEDFGGDDD